jgi:acetyl esterase/lipase
MPGVHAIVLPGGGYQVHAPHEAEPVAAWLGSLGLSASVFRYPLNTRHPGPLDAVRAAIAARRGEGAPRVGVVGFSAGGHLAGHAALASEPGDPGRPDFALLGYAITSMETDTYKSAQDVLLGPGAPAGLRRRTSLDRLAHRGVPPFFIWHTAEDDYVPPEHSYRLAAALAGHGVAHTLHVFEHGPHSLGLAIGAGETERWTELAAAWLDEQSSGAGARSPQ